MISHASKVVAAQLRRGCAREAAAAQAGFRSLSTMSMGSSHIGEVTYRPLSSLHEAVYPVDLDGATGTLSSEEVSLDPRSYGYRVAAPLSKHDTLCEDDTDFYPSLGGLLNNLTAAEPYYNASFRPGADPTQEAAALPNVIVGGSHDEEVAVYESHMDWDAQLRTEEAIRQVVTDFDE